MQFPVATLHRVITQNRVQFSRVALRRGRMRAGIAHCSTLSNLYWYGELISKKCLRNVERCVVVCGQNDTETTMDFAPKLAE